MRFYNSTWCQKSGVKSIIGFEKQNFSLKSSKVVSYYEQGSFLKKISYRIYKFFRNLQQIKETDTKFH